MSKPGGWWKSALTRSDAPKIVSERVFCVILDSPAGLKWIESRPGGSAVTALPSDIATGLTARLSVRAACAGAAPSAASDAAAASAVRAKKDRRRAGVVVCSRIASEHREGEREVQ